MEYFENLFNIDTQEEVAVHMCGIDCIRRGNYFGGEYHASYGPCGTISLLVELRFWGHYIPPFSMIIYNF